MDGSSTWWASTLVFESEALWIWTFRKTGSLVFRLMIALNHNLGTLPKKAGSGNEPN